MFIIPMQLRRASGPAILISVALSFVNCFAVEPARNSDLPALAAKAERGDAKSQVQLAKLYLAGIEGKMAPDPQQAVRWLERAAALGEPDAQFLLGLAHLRKITPNPDPQVGLELLRKAADSNHIEALRVLASIVASGQGARAQPELALHYLTKAAELGDGEAQNDLAGC